MLILLTQKQTQKNTLNDVYFLPNIKVTTEVFMTLILSIKRLEAENASVFDIWSELYDLYNIYKNMEASTSNTAKMDYNKTMCSILDQRFVVFYEDLYLISFFLNPENRDIQKVHKVKRNNLN